MINLIASPSTFPPNNYTHQRGGYRVITNIIIVDMGIKMDRWNPRLLSCGTDICRSLYRLLDWVFVIGRIFPRPTVNRLSMLSWALLLLGWPPATAAATMMTMVVMLTIFIDKYPAATRVKLYSHGFRATSSNNLTVANVAAHIIPMRMGIGKAYIVIMGNRTHAIKPPELRATCTAME